MTPWLKSIKWLPRYSVQSPPHGLLGPEESRLLALRPLSPPVSGSFCCRLPGRLAVVWEHMKHAPVSKSLPTLCPLHHPHPPPSSTQVSAPRSGLVGGLPGSPPSWPYLSLQQLSLSVIAHCLCMMSSLSYWNVTEQRAGFCSLIAVSAIPKMVLGEVGGGSLTLWLCKSQSKRVMLLPEALESFT